MALPTAQAVAEKWATRAGAASQDYVAGVQGTDKDPTALAIANQQRLKTNFNAAVDSGLWAQRLRDVGASGWKAAVAAKGGNNYSTGVNAAKDKVQQAFSALLAYEGSGLSTILAMPSATDADREARMLAWTRYMRNYRRP
jgi:hypothetical protein